MMSKGTAMTGPRGWTPSTISHRYFANGEPQSYDAETHSCEAVISTGAAVPRVFGREILEISKAACDLSRVPVPLLDSHSQQSIADIVGRVESAWVGGGKLHGRIVFAQTERGKLAESMIARSELSALSCGYRVDEWSCVDDDGDPVDPSRASWGDDLTFTATRWQLLEASCFGIPADAGAMVRSLGGCNGIGDIVARMRARQAIMERQAMFDREQAVHDDE
jgi:hypothetical protein